MRTGDAVAVDVGQVHAIKGGSAPLELMVIGVARDLATKAAWQEAQALSQRGARR
jgi:hypothetical protein